MTELPFLDLLLKRINSGELKLSVYRKPTHTDQYLNFMSHHPIDHKMSVVRTLLERSQNLLCQNLTIKRRKIFMFKNQDALRTCGYPEWSFQKARRQMKQMKPKKKKKQDVAVTRPSVVIPYVQKVSETVAGIMKKYKNTPQRS